MAEVTAAMRLLAMQMRQDYDDAGQRRRRANDPLLPGPEKSDLLESARRFENAALSRGLELGGLIEACFQKDHRS